MTTAQLNIRVPAEIKHKAQVKANKYGTNLNFLIKMFLAKFIIDDNLVLIKQDIDMEKIFDKGTINYLNSQDAKKTTKSINQHIDDILKDENKYLV